MWDADSAFSDFMTEISREMQPGSDPLQLQ